MPRRNMIILGAAILLGLVAVFIANSWFSGVEKRQAQVAERQQLVRIAVATSAIGFGAPLTQENIRMVSWPASSVPPGAFTDAKPLLGGRVAVRPIAVGEPILAARVSGSNGRASIANSLPDGMLAVAIPINEVSGVGGFVAPGDVVDVLLTRNIPGGSDDKMTTVVMGAVPVLGIDQLADDNKTDPKIGKTATLQVDQFGAQKLALASQVGQISLALRNVENLATGPAAVVTAKQLGGGGMYIRSRAAPSTMPAQPQLAMAGLPLPTMRSPVASPVMLRHSGPGMTVIRGTQPTQYEVNRDAGR